MNRALPITLSTGTVPVKGSPVHRMPFCASAGLLEANIALLVSNASLAALIATALAGG